jgi:hypothetical protein
MDKINLEKELVKKKKLSHVEIKRERRSGDKLAMEHGMRNIFS